ncbi:MAG: PQQ-binding-like beta-propeller repeat protein [Phycisphaerales bacterium]|nr:PQQ-binding-like beta-propeller repeat protein [Phycisphaeraceae bacterium]MDG1360831.1 PQQ-binding-like beta-propeller repeat protein [Phycisphaerales bacterium]MDG2132752.1 PQQ-binding-like beta-propeller repeat protein [Phycisphaerales bacterium]
MSDIGIEKLVFVGGKGAVVAFDRFDGAEAWSWEAEPQAGWVAKLGIPAYLSVVLDGDRLIVASPKGVWCLDPLTGAEVWKAETSAFRGGYPVIAGAMTGHDGGATAAATGSAAARQAAASGSAGMGI